MQMRAHFKLKSNRKHVRTAFPGRHRTGWLNGAKNKESCSTRHTAVRACSNNMILCISAFIEVHYNDAITIASTCIVHTLHDKLNRWKEHANDICILAGRPMSSHVKFTKQQHKIAHFARWQENLHSKFRRTPVRAWKNGRCKWTQADTCQPSCTDLQTIANVQCAISILLFIVCCWSGNAAPTKVLGLHKPTETEMIAKHVPGDSWPNESVSAVSQT